MRITGDWLARAETQEVLGLLEAAGHRAWAVGGCVRNAILGQPVADVDISTDAHPERVAELAAGAGLKCVPTGIGHGTVTVIAGHEPYEITTFRRDVETDGRRAVVAFADRIEEDAMRRDFTMNALYARRDGEVIDPLGSGVADALARRIRFVGEAGARIREDYLRILRFFRFFAWYGDGRPDPEGLRACARLKDGMVRLSAERVWAELKKLLAAPDPSRALLWMRQTGVLSLVLPESEKWGIDAVHALVAAGRDLGWRPDPLLRLEAIVPADPARMAALASRLKLSKAEAARLAAWAMTGPVAPSTGEAALAKIAYRGDRQAVDDRVRLGLAAARAKAGEDSGALAEAGGYLRLLRFLEGWEKPVFPVKGSDLAALGMASGPRMGETLSKLETEWVESGFRAGRDALLARAEELAARG